MAKGTDTKSYPLRVTFNPHTDPRPESPEYWPERCNFVRDQQLVDEKLIDHGRVRSHHDTRSQKTSHPKDLENLVLLAQVTRIQWGQITSDGDHCLVSFRFQFQDPSNTPSRSHLERAEIKITVFRKPGLLDSEGKDPTFADYGPKHIDNAEEPSKCQYHQVICPDASKLEYAHHAPREEQPRYPLASFVEARHFGKHLDRGPNMVKYWVRGDPQEEKPGDGGILMDFECATVVDCPHPHAFDATVEVRIGPVLEFVARPWTFSEPVRCEDGIPCGIPIRTRPASGISGMGEEEWKELVTPQGPFGRKRVDEWLDPLRHRQ